MQRAALKLPPFFRFAACSMQHAKHFQLYLVHFMAVDGAAVEFILLPNSKCKNRAHKKQHQQQVKDTDKVGEGEKGGKDRGAGIYALCCCCQDTEMRQATKTQQMRQTFHFWVCASAPAPPPCRCKAATSFDEQDASPKPEELKCGGTCVQVCVCVPASVCAPEFLWPVCPFREP